MPEAVSGQQQKLFGLALAVKKGDIPAAKVTSNVRQIAMDTSMADLEDLAGTKTVNLPDRVAGGEEGGNYDNFPAKEKPVEERIVHPGFRPSDDAPRRQYKSEADFDDNGPQTPEEEFGYSTDDEEPGDYNPHLKYINNRDDTSPGDVMKTETSNDESEQNIGDIVRQYSKYGKVFLREPMVQLAQQLSQIADGVETQLTTETNDWYDKHTIGRNVKEMKAYAKEFEKLAQEADEFNTRMQALYSDMGRVLERYFDVYDPADKGGEMLTEPDNSGGVMQESTTVISDSMTMRALPLVRKKLTMEHRIIFDRLSPETKRKVIWRLI